MRKLVKAAAVLTAGCMLLSTSAFAMEAEISELKDGVATVKITELGAGQSTILVLDGKDTAVESASESNILYINQDAIVDGAVTYTVNLGADFKGDATIWAGGTSETATKLGVLSAAPAGATGISITYANGEAVSSKAHTNEFVPVEFKAVVEGTPVGEVVWSVSDETVGTISADGVFTPGMTLGSTLGEVVIKATVDGKEASVTLNVWRYGDIDQDGWPSEEDAKELNLLQVGESSLYAPFMEDLETGDLSWIWVAGDLDQDGWPSEEDAKCLNLFQVGSYDDLWGMLPAE